MDSIECLSLPVNSVFLFHLSLSQNFDFENIFIRADDSTKILLSTITNTRSNVFHALTMEDPQCALTAVEIYLPYLFGLIEEAKNLPDDIPIPRLKLSWTSSLGSKYSKKYFTCNNWHFEVVNVILMYGLLYRAKAYGILKHITSVDDLNKYSVDAVKNLRIAAGIFDYIKEVELSRWTHKPQELLPEKYTEYYTILSVLSIAEAEQIAIKKAFNNKMGYPALSKICIDVSAKYKYISDILLSPGFCDTFVMPHINTYCAFNNHLYELFAYKLIGITTTNNGEYGKAIAYLDYGIQRSSSFDECKKDKTADAVRIRSHYSAQLSDLQLLYKKLSKENSLIYYEPIPQVSQLELPKPRQIIEPIKWTPPEPINISLTMQEASSCLIM